MLRAEAAQTTTIPPAPGTEPHRRAACKEPGTWKQVPGPCGRCPAARLNSPHGLGLRAAVALRDLEFDPLAFFKAAVTIRLDSRKVNEDVPTTVDRDEAVALVRVEPFDGALSHTNNSLTLLGLWVPPLLAKPVDRDAVLGFISKLSLP